MFETAWVALDLAPDEQPIIDCLPELQRWGVRRVILTGEIARHARSKDASLIVLGKPGQNPLASLAIGSTAAQLCEMAGRPVLMVH